MATVRIGMAQMLVEGGDVDANLARALRMIADAGKAGCQFVVLPEVCDIGWIDESAATLAQSIPGKRSELLSQAANSARVVVVAGLTERCGDRVYNSAVAIGTDGTIQLTHRKINELAIGRMTYSIGDRLGVFETDCGVVGINICADNFQESHALADAMALMGARLLLSPCAWAVPAEHDETDLYGKLWEDSYRRIAQRTGMATVGMSNVGWLRSGAWSGWKAIGCSLAMDYTGKIAAKGPYGNSAEALIIADVSVRDHG